MPSIELAQRCLLAAASSRQQTLAEYATLHRSPPIGSSYSRIEWLLAGLPKKRALEVVGAKDCVMETRGFPLIAHALFQCFEVDAKCDSVRREMRALGVKGIEREYPIKRKIYRLSTLYSVLCISVR